MQTISERVHSAIAITTNIDVALVAQGGSLMDDLGMDTIDIIEVIMAIEEEFKLPAIDDDEAQGLLTVADFITYVEKHTQC